VVIQLDRRTVCCAANKIIKRIENNEARPGDMKKMVDILYRYLEMCDKEDRQSMVDTGRYNETWREQKRCSIG